MLNINFYVLYVHWKITEGDKKTLTIGGHSFYEGTDTYWILQLNFFFNCSVKGCGTFSDGGVFVIWLFPPLIFLLFLTLSSLYCATPIPAWFHCLRSSEFHPVSFVSWSCVQVSLQLLILCDYPNWKWLLKIVLIIADCIV